jgi:hypothetical protein
MCFLCLQVRFLWLPPIADPFADDSPGLSVLLNVDGNLEVPDMAAFSLR